MNTCKSLYKWSGNERLLTKKSTEQKIRKSAKFTAAITALIIYMKNYSVLFVKINVVFR